MKTGANRRPRASGNDRSNAKPSVVGGVWGCPKYLIKLRYQYYRTGRTGGLLKPRVCHAVEP